MSQLASLAMAAVVIAAPLATASAHAFLQSADPPVGGTVSEPPKQVVIDYTEGVEPAFSSITVEDAAGAREDTGGVHTAAGDDKRLIVGLKPLPPGTYKVTWHATSTDTHKTNGGFSFTVGK